MKLLIMVLLISVGWVMASNARAAGVCYASSEATLSTCVAGLHSGANDKIEVTNNIDCAVTGSGCSYLLRGIGSAARSIEIYGTNSNVTIYRNPSVKLFQIENSTNVIIRNLRIFERNKRVHNYQSCSYQRTDSAPITIDRDTHAGVGKSDSIFLNTLTIDTGEPDIIQIGRADNVNIVSSSFTGSGHFGIWMANWLPKTTVRVFDNVFSNIGANAILISNVTNAWVSGNTFYGNHATNPFCMPNGNHTGGGQVVVEQGVKNLVLQSNHIHDGGNAAVNGIEFADGSAAPIENVTIDANYIYNNPNGGIVLNTATPANGVTGVTIKENALYGNGARQVKVNGHKDVDIFDNYYTQNLSISPRANFSGTAKTCNLNSSGTCAITINWQTQSAPNTQVIVGETGLFSVNPSGSQTVSWITAPGGAFEVFSSATGTEPIARIYVKGL